MGKVVDKELTPCLWHGHQPHGVAGIQQQPLGCNQLQSGEGWSGGPPSLGSLRSGGCKVAAKHRDNVIISNSAKRYNDSLQDNHNGPFTVICKPLLLAKVRVQCYKFSANQQTDPVCNNDFVTITLPCESSFAAEIDK